MYLVLVACSLSKDTSTAPPMVKLRCLDDSGNDENPQPHSFFAVDFALFLHHADSFPVLVAWSC
jgi:hypothetical protein